MTPRDEVLASLALLSEQESTQTALFHQAASASLGLGVTDTKALSILLRDGPQTAGALMQQLHVTSGAVTGVIDRLERAGFVRRTTDASDRRRVVVVADADRIAERNGAYVRIGEAFEELYAEYTDEELAFLARYLRDAVGITERETARIAAG